MARAGDPERPAGDVDRDDRAPARAGDRPEARQDPDDAQLGPAAFDARFSALWRSYVYLLWCADAPNPLYARYAPWVRERVDTPLLAEAMRTIVGTHDFRSLGRVRAYWHFLLVIVLTAAVLGLCADIAR